MTSAFESTDEIRRYLTAVCLSGLRYELRCFNRRGKGGGGPSKTGRIPDDLESLVAFAAEKDAAGWNVYVCLNPVKDDTPPDDKAAEDDDVLGRRWLVIDLDPKREAEGGGKIPATDAERKKTAVAAGKVLAWLELQGGRGCLKVDSGNGYYIVVPIDLPNDPASYSICGRVLTRLQLLLDEEDGAEIDQKMKNASRVSRLAGTTNRKNVATDERPWRRARYLSPGGGCAWDAATAKRNSEILSALACAVPQPEEPTPDPEPRTGAKTRFTMKGEPSVVERARAWLRKYERPSVDGEHGSVACYRVACVLVHGFDLTDGEALEAIAEWNATRCQPPWSEKELLHKFADARKDTGHKKPRGHLLNSGRLHEPQPASRPRAKRPDGLNPVFTFYELDGHQIPPPVWLVQGLLTAGSYDSIQGRPKGGKSFIALQLVVCYAAGLDFLGMPTSAAGRGGKVLYLALEDNLARVQKRTRKLAGGLGLDAADKSWRGRLVITIDREGEDEEGEVLGGLAWLRHLIESHKPELAVVDTKARLLGPPPPGVSGYAHDYAVGAAFQELALSTGATIVVLTHTKKRQDAEEDHLDASQGTTGETAAQDVVMTLSHPRGTHSGRLRAAGRDLDEDLDLVLEYDPNVGPWVSLGATPPKIPDPERAATWLREFLKDGPRAGTDCVKQGNTALGMKHAMPWWRDRVLKDKLEGKPQKQRRSKEGGEGKEQVWYWALPGPEKSEEREKLPAASGGDRPAVLPFNGTECTEEASRAPHSSQFQTPENQANGEKVRSGSEERGGENSTPPAFLAPGESSEELEEGAAE